MSARRRREAWIGGPGTILPNRVESFLSWSLALSCLTVSGYNYIVDSYLKPFMTRQIRSWIRIKRRTKAAGNVKDEELPCWLPLMCHSRSELDRATPQERYRQLLALVTRTIKANPTVHIVDESCTDLLLPDDDTLVELIRTNEMLRRLASLAMRPEDDMSILVRNENAAPVRGTPLGRQLMRLWPRLLVLPPLPDCSVYPFAISLIVPCYNEQASDVSARIQQALSCCAFPSQVQVVVAASGIQHETFLKELCGKEAQHVQRGWGGFCAFAFREESGRGPCLNFGAQHAQGAIYAFCHSDTCLPNNWDTKLVQTFYPEDDNDCRCEKSPLNTRRVNACAFRFGIHTPKIKCQDDGAVVPPGIRAVEFTANLRCQWWSLPYGDQCLSLPASIFEYLGGFPHQCIMEDYELIALLRKRAALLPTFLKMCHETRMHPGEQLSIVAGAPALCSARRWQRYGVLHVTFTNSKLVAQYVMGRSRADEIYEQYYGNGLSVAAQKSPWENQLETLLKL